MEESKTVDDDNLGGALRSLSDSATDLEQELAELNDAIDELQASTEQCSERQRAASESLAGAADSLQRRAQPSPVFRSGGPGGVPADD
jgi:septal ring factor EnvC (AmiA/AmiB activator)